MPLTREQSLPYMAEVLGWEIGINSKQISRDFKFDDFKTAMKFVNSVAELAEEEGHHPDIHISYNKVRLINSTHAIGGLTENDFILAAKINRIK
ncbi:MAG: 4a-hydroxytetrahydrobiopterin dehydratase [Candidatus Harrisonbacteria bacterium CG10_big_fil_rev_8_21_14_0_10_40_38]|uniref:Putative pterin-4-alpha-carbinolamine dehydratase n=1 Tax=Candidatus Harrisonbacteria bacterium CG10_big_fil_rev_8_21_14_0_10_40_38 TaxID=1974583 RepID=A0A2H0USK0_9BACT|nr:MAG: 4a-hydroxytetrahydrobiopterin dehydratase [Candidatus Harrisonbacteria bacterium CG10_big_fil_rev_8_21_14_0_10_40_38]